MILLLSILLGAFSAQATELSVVDVHRNIPLAEDDNVYKDFYINGGTDAGFKKNLVVTAVRKMNIRDSSGANSVGEIVVPVGQLKVIAVYDRITVAREFNLLSRDELPMLEQTGIMSGDLIDLKGSFVDTSKPKTKRKVSENSSASPAALVAAIAIPVVKGPAPASVSPAQTAPPAAPLPPIATAPAPAKVAEAAPTELPEKH